LIATLVEVKTQYSKIRAVALRQQMSNIGESTKGSVTMNKKNKGSAQAGGKIKMREPTATVKQETPTDRRRRERRAHLQNTTAKTTDRTLAPEDAAETTTDVEHIVPPQEPRAQFLNPDVPALVDSPERGQAAAMAASISTGRQYQRDGSVAD
jgi:hypothetical protein